MPAGKLANKVSDETSSKTISHINHEPPDCKEEDEGPEPEALESDETLIHVLANQAAH